MLFTIAKIEQQLRCSSTDKSKMWCIDTVEPYVAMRKEEGYPVIFDIVGLYTKQGESEKDKYYVMPLICRI